ncbi:uncharacterized protein HMPREF1541_06321 [Cyphellophora europaea CBS 101466]|uniref:Uncharacterized protein n=1 Tax=Cyphellophora europaea (strain CBS 101466) TaxID=1220924 RepID=W2RPP8_CYPE1|nr:uncharacterized protein HMPREF1541_06321 [Cyphellophora europaea CBS 101466]ETN38290.1 hypothetical protein HMPREF1541_06321 [Cyphellophora europaea CBS 101466]
MSPSKSSPLASPAAAFPPVGEKRKATAAFHEEEPASSPTTAKKQCLKSVTKKQVTAPKVTASDVAADATVEAATPLRNQAKASEVEVSTPPVAGEKRKASASNTEQDESKTAPSKNRKVSKDEKLPEKDATSNEMAEGKGTPQPKATKPKTSGILKRKASEFTGEDEPVTKKAKTVSRKDGNSSQKENIDPETGETAPARKKRAIGLEKRTLSADKIKHRARRLAEQRLARERIERLEAEHRRAVEEAANAEAERLAKIKAAHADYRKKIAVQNRADDFCYNMGIGEFIYLELDEQERVLKEIDARESHAQLKRLEKNEVSALKKIERDWDRRGQHNNGTAINKHNQATAFANSLIRAARNEREKFEKSHEAFCKALDQEDWKALSKKDADQLQKGDQYNTIMRRRRKTLFAGKLPIEL